MEVIDLVSSDDESVSKLLPGRKSLAEKPANITNSTSGCTGTSTSTSTSTKAAREFVIDLDLVYSPPKRRRLNGFASNKENESFVKSKSPVRADPWSFENIASSPPPFSAPAPLRDVTDTTITNTRTEPAAKATADFLDIDDILPPYDVSLRASNNVIPSDDTLDSLPDNVLDAIERGNHGKSITTPRDAHLHSSSQPEPWGGTGANHSLSGARSLLWRAHTFTNGDDEDDDDDHRSNPPTKRSKLTALEREESRVRRDQAREDRARAKEDEKQRRRLAREESAKDKRIAAELAEVNKVRVDKKESTREMIVDFPASMDVDKNKTAHQALELLRLNGVETQTCDSKVEHTIKWRRKCKAVWNSDLARWDPLPETEVQEEKHVLCWMPAQRFAALVACEDADADSLDNHVASFHTAYSGCKILYLIEGLTGLLRREELALNRAHVQRMADLQQQGSAEAPERPASRKQRKAAATPAAKIDRAVIERALMRLQIQHGCLVHQTDKPCDSAEWIASFTQHISTIPYRERERDRMANFCMERNQVRSGEHPPDSYFRMLQEVVRVTEGMALGIMQLYPDVMTLAEEFAKQGPLMLEDVQKYHPLRNKTASKSDAAAAAAPRSERIGPSVSRRLHSIFTCMDPDSINV